MCGIVGYIGNKHVVPLLLEGLHRLEYRGYDSAGIAVIEGGELCRVRMPGKVNRLASRLAERPFESTMGMGHTRWATHGKPSEANAHPHANGDETIMVVHNGIIENYQTLREQLSARGYRFRSETDTEVVAHLIEDEYTGNLTQAVKRALRKITGTYGLVVMHAQHPHEMVAARRGSPMVLVVGETEMLLASDVAAFLRLTDQVVYLEDDDIVTLRADEYVIDTLADKPVEREAERIEWQADAVELTDFPHYMLKEIHEQPDTITNALRGRLIGGEGIVHLGGLDKVLNRLKEAQHLVIVSCGTSSYAGLYARYVFERLTDLVVEVEIASEMRYRKTNIRPGTVVLGISQSGETADTIAAAYAHYDNFLFIGRKYNYPMALEGALKLKEISYIHAEGCAAGEMKHGFIAMIDQRFPTVCLATKDMMYEKVLSNMQEIKSRGSKMIAITTEGNEEITEVADDVIYTPPNLDFLQPIPAVVALQLFAYYCAIERGCDIDQPRNLAKSVTVE